MEHNLKEIRNENTKETTKENLHPSLMKMDEEQNTEDLKRINDSIEEWIEEVYKDLCTFIKTKNIHTFTIGFIHEGTGRPIMLAHGDKYRAAICATKAARQLKEEIARSLEV